MLSTRSNNSLRDFSTEQALFDLEQQIRLLDNEINPLRTKTKKKLTKIEGELRQTNLLIDSAIGTKKDQAALRQTKRQLRERRVQIWEKLEKLPILEAERRDLERDLQTLRRHYGILDS